MNNSENCFDLPLGEFDSIDRLTFEINRHLAVYCVTRRWPIISVFIESESYVLELSCVETGRTARIEPRGRHGSCRRARLK